MKSTIAAVCIFLFFATTLLLLYQIGGTGGSLRGGFLMMVAYYSNTYADRPTSFILANKNDRSDLSAPILVQDQRSLQYFKSKVGEEQIQTLGTNAWGVTGISQREFFLFIRGMEIYIVLTGSIMIMSLILPFYYDVRQS